MIRALTMSVAAVLPGVAQARSDVQPVEVTAPGPQGALAGTLLDPGSKAPLIVIVPGSGPTDRNGDNRLGVAGGPYRQLAEALAARGIATLRVDKRGMFGSSAAIADPNAVTLADYAGDVRGWIKTMRVRTGRRCVWLAGHSEGGLVALLAAQQPDAICGVILIAAVGRPLGTIMREQFRANPANAPILDSALQMIDSLEAGRPVDPATLAPPLPSLFPASVQGFLIDMLRQDPAALANRLRVPVLVVQGDRDVQVGIDDAQALTKAAPGAKLAILPGMTHVLRLAAGADRAASLATYADAALPVAPALVGSIADFVTDPR